MAEGAPSLYADILYDAPFISDDVILKFEVTNGTTVLDQDAQILVTYLDDDDDGVVDGSSSLLENDLKLYRYDIDASSWEELDTSVDDVYNCVVTWSNRSGLYAVGHKDMEGASTIPEDPELPAKNITSANGRDEADGGIMCATMNYQQDMNSRNAAALIVICLPLFLWMLIRVASRKADDTKI